MTKNSGSRGVGQQALSGAFWTLLSSLGRMVLRVGVLGVLARLLAPRDYGVVAAALVVTEVLRPFAEMGIAQALVQREEVTREHQRVAFTILVGANGLLCAALWLTREPAAALVGAPGAAALIPLFAFGNLLRAPGSLAEAMLLRELRAKAVAVANLVSYIIGYGIVGILAAWTAPGPMALVYAQLTQTAVQTAILVALRPFDPRPLASRVHGRDLFRTGGGFLALVLANQFAVQVDNAVVGQVLGERALGFYSRAYNLVTSTQRILLNQLLNNVLFPAFSRLQHEPQRLGPILTKGVGLSLLLGLPVTGGFVVLAPEVTGIVLGPGWSAVVPPMRLLAVATIFRIVEKNCAVALQARGRPYFIAWVQLATGLGIAAASAFGALQLGLPGAALGVVAITMLRSSLLVWVAFRDLGASLRGLIPAGAPALALGAAVVLPAWFVAQILRPMSGDFVVLAGTSLAGAGAAIAACTLAPRRTLGISGAWFLKRVAPALSRRGPKVRRVGTLLQRLAERADSSQSTG